MMDIDEIIELLKEIRDELVFLREDFETVFPLDEHLPKLVPTPTDAPRDSTGEIGPVMKVE